MSYSAQKFSTLQRLGVEQLPTLSEPTATSSTYHHDHFDELHHLERHSSSESCSSFEVAANNDPSNPFAMNLPIRGRPVPGRRCPNCLARGQTYWVAYGKRCAQCGTEVN